GRAAAAGRRLPPPTARPARHCFPCRRIPEKGRVPRPASGAGWYAPLGQSTPFSSFSVDSPVGTAVSTVRISPKFSPSAHGRTHSSPISRMAGNGLAMHSTLVELRRPLTCRTPRRKPDFLCLLRGLDSVMSTRHPRTGGVLFPSAPDQEFSSSCG